MQTNASSIEDAASIPVIVLIEDFIIIRNFHHDRWSLSVSQVGETKARGLYCFCKSKVPLAVQSALLPLNRNVPDIVSR